MKNYTVRKLLNHEYRKWLLKKHYAKRLANVSYGYGLIDQDYNILGVCTFGSPVNRQFNNGDCIFYNYKVRTLELNRLVMNSNQEKNLWSFFLSSCLKLLPKPLAIISYADPNNNHHGYIYQATNWIYTGTSGDKYIYHFANGDSFDIRRGLHKKPKVVSYEKLKPTYRYLYLLGSKKEKKDMLKDLKYEHLDYPKGNNKNYECIDIDMKIQPELFSF